MSKDNQKKQYKKFIMAVAGFFILILGITLILVWWANVMLSFYSKGR